MFNTNIDFSESQSDFKHRKLAVVKNILTPKGQAQLINEAKRIQPYAEKNRNLKQVHSGKLHELNSTFLSFAKSKELETIVSKIANQKLGLCPGSKDAKYSLYKSDFGTKVNYYDGDGLSSIGWHYDKNHSWKDKTIVVIYTILFRKELDDTKSIANTPTSYEIIENMKKVKMVVPENALHIHDTDNVYHRAVVPKGWKRWIYILHFTKAPCLPNPKRNGYSLDLITKNALMRTYVELFIERDLRPIFIIIAFIILLKVMYKR